MGSAIPKNLPRSTLACPPKESFIKQFMEGGASSSNTARGTRAAHRMAETNPAGFFT